MRRDNGLDVVPADGEGTDWETVGVAADDGVGVLLGEVTGRVLRPDQDVVCLTGIRKCVRRGLWYAYLAICLDKEAMEDKSPRDDLPQ